MPHSRRTFLKAAAVGAACAAAGAPMAGRAGIRRGRSAADPTPVRLGVATYSLREFSRPEAIAMVNAVGTPWINVKSFHLPYDSTDAEFEQAWRAFGEAGLEVVGGGTITLHEDTDEDVGKYFEYARKAGMPLMVIAPKPDVLPRIETFVKQYDIKAAIHNHGPEDEYFPAPSDALKLIQGMDPRMGLCVDVGHTARTGNEVVQEIADAGPRVLDMHMKDLRDLSDRDSQTIVGQGAIPIPDIFEQLKQMDYPGYVNLEYEIHADHPLPGMKESFAYMRGVLAGLSGRS